jgi:hypothetical protein
MKAGAISTKGVKTNFLSAILGCGMVKLIELKISSLK